VNASYDLQLDAQQRGDAAGAQRLSEDVAHFWAISVGFGDYANRHDF
jgi:hypothetical protein